MRLDHKSAREGGKERETDGVRSYRLLPGIPLPTSHGENLYQEAFGVHRQAALL
jgi:hypothetical protein